MNTVVGGTRGGITTDYVGAGGCCTGMGVDAEGVGARGIWGVAGTEEG